MSSYKIIYTTIDKLTAAKKLAHNIVEERLAACVNIIPGMLSVYEWEGKVKEDPECVVIFKTRGVMVEELKQAIRKHHHYEVPAIFEIDLASVDDEYREWIDIQTSRKVDA